MFPNISNLNIPGSQTESSNTVNPIIANSFVTPNIPTSEPSDPVRTFFIVLPIISAVLVSFLFGYSVILRNQISSLKNTVSKYDNNLDLLFFHSNLSEIGSLSQRFKIVDNIYNQHIYVSQMLFPILESLVESGSDSYVYFNRFSVRHTPTATNVSLSGVAIDYESLIRQINNFKDKAYEVFIKNFKLNSLSLDQVGNVLFDISFDVNIAGKQYDDYLNGKINEGVSSIKNNLQSGPLFKSNTSPEVTTPVSVQDLSENLNIIISTTTSTVTATTTSITSTTTATSTSATDTNNDSLDSTEF